jgi:hypothetical protein
MIITRVDEMLPVAERAQGVVCVVTDGELFLW